MNPPRDDARGRELSDVVARVLASPARCGAVRVVAIDGGAASGKTTLADRLADALGDAAVVHTDDLLDGWDDQFGFWPRLVAQVLVPLAEGRPARYQRYDWVAGRFGDGIELAPSRVLVVEGVSAIAACAEHASVRLLLDVPRSERERRWVERDGPLSGKALTWLAREDDFFARWQPPHDVVRLP